MSLLTRIFKKSPNPLPPPPPPREEAPKARPTAKTAGQHKPEQLGGQALSGVRQIIAVASGKGGVGKSTSAVNLAYCLIALGYKVGLLDADIYGPSLAIMTGVGNPEEMQGALVVPPIHQGIKMISVAMFASASSAQILRGPMAGNMIKQFLTNVAWGELDYLLIDYPPGTGDIQLTISQTASLAGAIMITSPQEIALADVRKAIAMFGTLKVPVLGIIETMSYFICDSCDKKHFIFTQGGGAKLAAEFALPLLGQIPLAAEITASSDEGKPLSLHRTSSPAAQAYRAAAEQCLSELGRLSQQNTAALGSFTLHWKQ